MRAIAYALTVVLTVACYWSGLNGPSYLIDDGVIRLGSWTEWDDPAGAVHIWEGDRHPLEVHYRPVSDTVLWASHQVWGENAIGYRVLNLFVYLLTIFLAIQILRRMRLPGVEWIGFFIAIHPIAVQSILWMIQIRGLLAIMFAVAALWASVHQHQKQSVRWGVLALLLLAMGLLSKTTIATFPVLLVILGLLCRVRPTRQTWLFVAATFAVTAAITLYDKHVVTAHWEQPSSIPLDERLSSAAGSALQYWRNVLVPYPLGFFYDYAISALEIVCAAGVAAALGGLWWMKRRAEAFRLLLVVAAFLVTLAPVIVARPVTVDFTPAQDRYALFALFFVVPYVGYLLATPLRPGSRARRYCIAGVIVAAAAGLGLTFNQVRIYADAQRLYEASVDVTPYSVYLRLFSAMSLRELGRYDEAQRVLRSRLLTDPVEFAKDPSARGDDGLKQNLALEMAQDALAKKSYAECLANLPTLDPDKFEFMDFPVEAIVAALRLESPDPNLRDQAAADRILARMDDYLSGRIEHVIFTPTMSGETTWVPWARLRYGALRASQYAARGQFHEAEQLVAKLLADPSLQGPGHVREGVRADLLLRQQSYQQGAAFMRPESQLLWRLNSWAGHIW
jgi:tetratricopeptide (TPR) repeat protein